MGNNHGGIERIRVRYYIFWHRHTHGGQFSRQGCADEIVLQSDGTFRQAEITSCGLNGEPLPAKGQRYRASIACCLQGPDKEKMKQLLPLQPQHRTETDIPYVSGAQEPGQPEGYRSWIENLRPGSVFGFKYFDFSEGCGTLSMTLRGQGRVELHLDSPESPALAELAVDTDTWSTEQTAVFSLDGVHSVYFTVSGKEAAGLDCSDLCFD